MSTIFPQAPFHHFDSNGSDIPDSFGYITLPNTSQLPQRTSSALQDSHYPTFVRGSLQSRNDNDTLEHTKSASSSKVPVYFNPLGGNVGLVCGRENHTKYSVLKNLLAASWKDREPHSRRDILCFTAENGSLEITQTVAGLLQKGESGEGDQKELEIIVLTWPSNLSNLRALHASSKNVKVLPLLVHPEDVKLEHLRHIYEGRVWGSQNAVFDDLLQGSRARGALVDLEEITLANLREKLNSNIAPWLRASIGGQVYPGAFFFLDLNPHLSQQLDDARSDSRASPAWMEWILQGQPRSSTSGSPTLQDDCDYSHKGPPLLLCVDWTGCTPEEHRVQNVLADIVLRQWVGHANPQPQPQEREREQGKVLDRGIVVCDNVHHYLSSEDPNPFTRTLSRLSHESTQSNPSPDSKATITDNNAPIPSFPAGSHGALQKSPSQNLLLLLTESPIAIPAALQDTSNFLILHRFTSPGWLTALEGHFHLHTHPPPLPSHSHSTGTTLTSTAVPLPLPSTSTKTSTSPVDISSSSSSSSSPPPPSLLDQILDLDDKHVLLFAPPKPAFVVFAPGTGTQSTPFRTVTSMSGSGSGSGYGSSHQSSYAIGGSPALGTANSNVNVNGVIQRPKKQSSSSSPTPAPVPVGRHLTKICLSKEDHLHPEIVERNSGGNGVPLALDVSVSSSGGGSGRDDSNVGVIGGNVRRNGSDPAGPVQPALGASSLSPYHIGAGGGAGANGYSRPLRSLLPQGGGGGGGGLTPSPSSSILRDRSPHPMAYHQLPGSHSPATHHWPTTREENPNHNHANANGGFPFASPSSSNPFISPSITAVNGYIHQQHQQRSPPSSPFTPINPSDAVISRPIGIGGGGGMGMGMSGGSGMGMGMGVPRRISPPSSSSASGMSFSFSNHGGNAITPSSSAANPSSISTSFGMSPTSPVGPGFAGRGTAFSPFATPSMLKTNQGDFECSGLGVAQGGLAAARNAHSISEKEMMASRYFFGAERTPQVTSSFGGTRRSPQPSSSERHSRTDTTSTTGSRDDTSSADYVEVSPGSDFSRLVGPVKDERPTSAVQKMESGPSKRSYAGVAAPARDSSQRRDTVLPPPGKDNTGPAPGTLRPPLTTSSQHSTTPPSSTDLQSPTSSSEPLPPPPIYPESFFWPLLDALEKSRAQVSTPHNRAQSVRHSVVGQELPPSARARLGLTFKEYVAAAARQGVIVTGDSGDKAWIAMREWKYPGKSYSGWPTVTTTTTTTNR